MNKLYQPQHYSVQIESGRDLSAAGGSSGNSPYTLCEFDHLRSRLNEAKSKLDIYYLTSTERSGTDHPSTTRIAAQWYELQNIIDIYKPLRKRVARDYNAQVVTNAWLKYYEIYIQYDLIPAGGDSVFHAFFNAELPGAALCAFNHYMKTKRRGEFDWRASSLAPAVSGKTTKEALGDIYGLYSGNRDKWLMDINAHAGKWRNDGDATKIENLRDWATRIGPNSDFGGVDLYSHDAGIDASADFNRQELANARIHLGCALAGFMTLRVGGSMVAKQYTYFEGLTWNLILIYSTLFDQFYLCKPLTSRPYNSEIYLVGKGFRGLPAATESLLTDKLVNFDTSPLIPSDVIGSGGEALQELKQFARTLTTQQINFIEENIYLFERYKGRFPALRKEVQPIAAERIKIWLDTYRIKPIRDEDKLRTM